MSIENIINMVFHWVAQHPLIGLLIGTLMAMIESFFPPIPLIAIVTANLLVFGYFLGALISWIGTVIGTIGVFFFVQRFLLHRFDHFRMKHPKVDHSFVWIKEKGFIPIVVLYIFPLTPSFMVSGLAALAGVKRKDFVFSVIIGKFFMILSLSAIGYSFESFFTKPLISLGILGGALGVTLIAKGYLSHFQKLHYLKNKVQEHQHKK